ncbi:MAG: LacI family DNA-binding transcriptional regulator [Geminicoccaceae bacterium]
MNEDRRPTVIDVAREAKVAVGTVSRYLNGLNVRAATRTRLEQAIAKLDFRANPLAQAIKSSRTRTLGFVTPSFDGFNAMILTHLVEAFRSKGYSILIFSHAFETESMREAVMSAADRRIDGLLFSGNAAARGPLQSLVKVGVPVVIYNNDIPDLNVDKVLVRDRLGAREAVRSMIALGHERIGIATGDLDTQTALNRLEGYRDALDEAGHAHDPTLEFEGAWRRETGRDATRDFLSRDKPPSAIFYSSDRIGRGGLDHLNHAGLTAGRDVDLVSFDDHEVFRMVNPGISAVAQPVIEIATHVADLMATRLDGRAPNEGRTVRLDCTFIRRGSLNQRTMAVT